MANYFVHKHQVGLSGIELKLYINFEKILLLDEKFSKNIFKRHVMKIRRLSNFLAFCVVFISKQHLNYTLCNKNNPCVTEILYSRL